MQTNVFATYDGFSRYYNTLRLRDAASRLPIPPRGWFVLREEWRWREKDYDFQMFKAILVFPVQ